jgi:hypothetical protein
LLGIQQGTNVIIGAANGHRLLLGQIAGHAGTPLQEGNWIALQETF